MEEEIWMEEVEEDEKFESELIGNRFGLKFEERNNKEFGEEEEENENENEKEESNEIRKMKNIEKFIIIIVRRR